MPREQIWNNEELLHRISINRKGKTQDPEKQWAWPEEEVEAKGKQGEPSQPKAYLVHNGAGERYRMQASMGRGGGGGTREKARGSERGKWNAFNKTVGREERQASMSADSCPSRAVTTKPTGSNLALLWLPAPEPPQCRQTLRTASVRSNKRLAQKTGEPSSPL